MKGFCTEEITSCQHLIALALAEDLGLQGDRTSRALIPPDRDGRAAFVARKHGVIAGLPAAALVCAAVDPELKFVALVSDGSSVNRSTGLAIVAGPLRSILAAERIALNFLQRLSGIASATCQFVDASDRYPVEILDTRKTVPGWRLLEKYAVRMGGGTNHRLGLHDGILIKDNHLAALDGDIRRAIELARSTMGNDGLPVEVEVDTLEQLDEALAARVDIVLLDNMTLDQLRSAVSRRDRASPFTKLEASGGVDLDSVQEIAATGIDRISVGAITHSAPALDIALDYLP